MSSKPLHDWTPVIRSFPLSKILGKPVLLKMECYQRLGSFKIRGIGKLCQALVAAGKKHLVSSSGGNAGYATAYAGKKLGVDVTVFMSTKAPEIYVNAIKSEGANVSIKGDTLDEANEAAKQYVKEVSGGFVPPFDHPTIWAGHSTIIDEVVKQSEKPGAILVAVGGGGLACGILQGLHRYGWDDVPLFTVETEGAASFMASVKANKVVTLSEINTVAGTLAAKRVTDELFDWTKKHTITPLTVTDKEAVQSCLRFLDNHRVLVEPACGAPLAVIYNNAAALKSVDSVLVIVCGGIGISVDMLGKYLEQLSVSK